MRWLLLCPLLLADPGQDEPRTYESMIVPYASNGEPDWAPSEDRPRHVINVTLAGERIHGGQVLEDEAAGVAAKLGFYFAVFEDNEGGDPADAVALGEGGSGFDINSGDGEAPGILCCDLRHARCR